jgi:heme-degrading monooxygenase HmoA
VNYVQIRSGKMNEAIAIYRDSVSPVVRQLPGNRGTPLLTDPKTGKAIMVGLWQTEADANAIVPSGSYKEQIAKLASVFAGTPVREVHEVSAEQPIQTGAKYARVATGQVQPGRMNETIRMVRDTNFPAYRQHQGFKGHLLFTNATTGKVIAISLWETEADITASDARIEKQRQRVREAQTRPPVVERYEVSVQV